jgi:DNA-binding NarL/FixJ family response regulator
MCRDGLRHSLSSWFGVEVVGEAGTGPDAVSLAIDLRPDVAVVESVLPGLNGVEVTRQIASECPSVRVVAVSANADWDIVARWMRAGASAYVMAGGGLAELRRASI